MNCAEHCEIQFQIFKNSLSREFFSKYFKRSYVEEHKKLWRKGNKVTSDSPNCLFRRTLTTLTYTLATQYLAMDQSRIGGVVCKNCALAP